MIRSTAIVVSAAAISASLVSGLAQSAQADGYVASPAIVNLNSLYAPGYPSSQVGTFEAKSVQLSAGSSLTRGISVFVGGATSALSYYIDLIPQSGQKLAVGRYSGLSSTTTDASLPTLNVTIGNTTMPVAQGEADVLDLATNPNGSIKRFDVVFRTSDTAPSNVLFGEIRLGEAEDTSSIVATRHLEWPQTPAHSTPIYATEWIRNTTAKSMSIGAVAVTAGARSDYAITNDGCSNGALAPGASCSFRVGFSPTVGGPRVAALTFSTNSATQTVSLAGTAPLGTNALIISGNDYVDGGTTHVLGGSQFTLAGITNLVTVGGFSFAPIAPNGSTVGTATARFAAPNKAEALAVGTHPAVSFTASTYPYATSKQYGVTVDGFGRGCGDNTGTITVRTFTLAADGTPSMVDLSFTQSCLNDPKMMTGTLQYHFRSDTTAPAAVTGLAVTGTTTRAVSWKRSSSIDFAFTIARLIPGDGKNATPTSGYAMSANTLSSVPLPALVTGQKYTIAVFAVDTTGNYGAPQTLSITG